MRPDVRYARRGGAALAYQVVGDGARDLLVVPGFLSNIEYLWRVPSMARFFSDLASRHRLILMDRRGSGLSDKYSDPPSQEQLMEDIDAVLDDAASPRTSVLGIWEGCATTLLYAASRPTRVSSLLLFSASATQRRDDDYPWAWTTEMGDEWLASLGLGWGTRAWIVRNARWMGPSLLDDPDELEHWITYTRLAASPSSAEAVMRLDAKHDVRSILPLVHTPTLLLHRTGDQVEEIDGARYMASKMPDARLVELPGDDGIPWLGDTAPLLREIHAFLGSGVREDTGTRERRLASVLFTDIVNSTATAATLGDARWGELVERHHREVRRLFAEHGGAEVDTAGDGFFAVFDGAARAARCALDIVSAVRDLGIEIRAGVHAGEVESVAGKAGGLAVVVGSRIAALGGPSEVLASSTVKDLTLGSGLTFEDRGDAELKGVPGSWRLYRVS